MFSIPDQSVLDICSDLDTNVSRGHLIYKQEQQQQQESGVCSCTIHGSTTAHIRYFNPYFNYKACSTSVLTVNGKSFACNNSSYASLLVQSSNVYNEDIEDPDRLNVSLTLHSNDKPSMVWISFQGKEYHNVLNLIDF